MKPPIDYLRSVMRRHPGPAPTPAPPPGPGPNERGVLPTATWTNAVRTAGACVCDVIYSSCRCGPQ